MTESEWLDGTDLEGMLDLLRGRASERKLRLFAVACCRRGWHLLPAGGSRTAVAVIEGHADGGSPGGGPAVLAAVGEVWEGVADVGAGGVVRSAAGRCAEQAARETALRAAAVLAAEAAGPCPFDTPGIAQHV